MNKKILRINYAYDFTLIGIITPMRIYRLCWFLNKQLKMDLARDDDHVLKNSYRDEVFFPRYHFYIEESETDYFLIGNKGTDGYLIPENKEIDYFLIIYNLVNKNELKHLSKRLKEVREIQSVFQIDPQKLRSKENLLF